MRVYQICNRHQLGKQGSASTLLFVPWPWEREIKTGFSAAQMEGERQRWLGALMLAVKKRREARRLDPLLFFFWTQMTCLQSQLVMLESSHD